MRWCFPTSCSFFLGQVTSAPAAAFQWLQCSLKWQWNYDAIGQWYRNEHSGDESKFETFFSLYQITNHFIEFKDYLLLGSLVWFPEDSLFICTTVYRNWEDSLILILHFIVRGEANLFFIVKSNHRLWYTAFPQCLPLSPPVGQRGTFARLSPTSTCPVFLVNTISL